MICTHNWVGQQCPYCDYRLLISEYAALEDECMEAEDRADRLAIIADALAAEIRGAGGE